MGSSQDAGAERNGLDVPADSLAAEMRYGWAPPATPAVSTRPSRTSLDRRFEWLAQYGASSRDSGVDDDLRRALDAVVVRASRRADVAVHARELDTGRVIYDHDGSKPLNPASNQKILTSAAALDLLGSEHTFETKVSIAGRTLILRGEGDPVLDCDDLQAMAVIVAQRLELGDVDRVVVDDSAFAERRFGPGLYDTSGMGAAHEAPSGALSVDFNTVEVRVTPVRGSRVPQVDVDASGAHVEVRNEAFVGRRGVVTVRTYAEGERTIVHVQGSMSRNARPAIVRRRITDPALHAGTVFAARLAEQWESEPLPVVRGSTPAGARTVVVNESPPLSEIIGRGLAYSNNFIAEQVLRTMAWRVFDEPGTWDGGRQILEAYWRGLGREDSAVLDNGSGLSRRGRLTAGGLVDVLVAASRETPALLDALPRAGEPGTLRGRLRRSAGRVRAKTGTLDGVSGLSGVLVDGEGRPAVAFSVLVNTHEHAFMPAPARRRVEDEIVYTLLAATG